MQQPCFLQNMKSMKYSEIFLILLRIKLFWKKNSEYVMGSKLGEIIAKYAMNSIFCKNDGYCN